MGRILTLLAFSAYAAGTSGCGLDGPASPAHAGVAPREYPGTAATVNSLTSGAADVTARLAAISPSPGIPDPQHDAVLEAMAGAVRPDDAEWAVMVKLYQRLREDQASVVARYAALLPGTGRPPGGGRPGGGGGPPAGGGGGGRPGSAGGGAGGGGPMQQTIAAAHVEFSALEARFRADARAALTTDQRRAAWDGCAASMNLAPASTHGALDEAFLDPDAGPKVGERAPDFTLRDLDGKPVSLSGFRGKPLVIEFGSYTCPAFREQAPRLQAVVDGFAGRANFVLVYGHEAHPTDGWVNQANTRAGIAIPSHASWEQRQKCALLTRQALGLHAPMLVDEMDEVVMRGWGGHPNTGYVLDSAGNVVLRQRFINADDAARVLAGLLP